jgi:hypothetical protein
MRNQVIQVQLLVIKYVIITFNGLIKCHGRQSNTLQMEYRFGSSVAYIITGEKKMAH